ncbi:MAG: hypothetical protein WAM26_18695 [Nitrososphaeraceae archaeon]
MRNKFADVLVTFFFSLEFSRRFKEPVCITLTAQSFVCYFRMSMPYMIVISSGLAFLSASLAVTVMTDSFCNSCYTNASANMNWR